MTGRGLIVYWLLLQGTYLAIGVVNFWMLVGLKRMMRESREREKPTTA